MKTYQIDPNKTEWLRLDGQVSVIVAHFKDGHKEKFSLIDFVTLTRRRQRQITRIDCYNKGEKIDEE